MACSKYTLTNTGSSIANFSYRRCDDNMWEYQVPLDPSETKNIWLINGTYGTAFSSVISLVNQGPFPPLNATATPTPTPTTTPTNTPTPSVTTTQTPTNTQTPTQTSSQTPTTTQTPTQTGTPTQTPTPSPTPYNYSFNLGYGDTPNNACNSFTYVDYIARAQGPLLSVGDILYTNAELSTLAPIGWYSDGSTTYSITANTGAIAYLLDGGCSVLVTPTPTITQTSTNTPTPSSTPTPTPTSPIVRYIHSSLCHSETSAQDACSCVGGASTTIWSDNPSFSESTLFWSDASGVNTGNPNGYYAVNGILYYVNDGCGVGCSSGSTLGYSELCGVTPTVTPTSTLTPTPTSTQILTPTPTQSGTPEVTPTPTSSSFGSRTFKVVMQDTARAEIHNYTLTQAPYVSTPGVGFTGATGTFPLNYTGNTVYGTHQGLTGDTVTFEITSSGSGGLSISTTINGSSTFFSTTLINGSNTVNLYVAGPVLSTDEVEFQIG